MAATAAVATTAAATLAAIATNVEAVTWDGVPMATVADLGRHRDRHPGGGLCLRSSTVRFSRRISALLVTGRLSAWQERVCRLVPTLLSMPANDTFHKGCKTEGTHRPSGARSPQRLLARQAGRQQRRIALQPVENTTRRVSDT